jgi:hypothetical protein
MEENSFVSAIRAGMAKLQEQRDTQAQCEAVFAEAQDAVREQTNGKLRLSWSKESNLVYLEWDHGDGRFAGDVIMDLRIHGGGADAIWRDQCAVWARLTSVKELRDYLERAFSSPKFALKLEEALAIHDKRAAAMEAK